MVILAVDPSAGDLVHFHAPTGGFRAEIKRPSRLSPLEALPRWLPESLRDQRDNLLEWSVRLDHRAIGVDQIEG